MHSLLISSSELEAMEKSSIAMAASLEYSVSAAMARSYRVGGRESAHATLEKGAGLWMRRAAGGRSAGEIR